MKRVLLLCLSTAIILCACEQNIPSRTKVSSTLISSSNLNLSPLASSSSFGPTRPALPTQPSSMVGEPEMEFTVVSYMPPIITEGATFTGSPALPAVEYRLPDPDNHRMLSQERIDFSFGVASSGKPHTITVENQNRFDAWGTQALAWDAITEEKVLYLTFDCGYEYENITSEVLDILMKKDIKTTFFCTMTYLRSCPEMVVRMLGEGHTVGNHSLSHPADCAALSREEMVLEALAVENYLRINFGYSACYFRFPSGVYSENAVEALNAVGYRSVFWSIAYSDWDPDNQQGPQKAYEILTGRLHPGAVILLHTTSRDNAAVLSDFIDYAISQGYTFRTLDEYPGWK